MWQEAIDTFMNGDFMLSLFQLFMAVVITIVNIILWPFSQLIAASMPALDSGFQQLADYFTYATTYMAWILNAFAVPAMAITIIAAFYLFNFTVTITAWTVKLIIKWKQAIW
jgi:hypothetical protein